MQLLPQVLLDLVDVAPRIHPVSLDVGDLLLVGLLLLLVALHVDLEIGVFWGLNYHVCDLLRGMDGGDGHLLLKPLLDDLAQRHVINFLGGGDLSSRDGLLLLRAIDLSLYLSLSLLLDHDLTTFLGFLLHFCLIICISLNLLLRTSLKKVVLMNR